MSLVFHLVLVRHTVLINVQLHRHSNLSDICLTFISYWYITLSGSPPLTDYWGETLHASYHLELFSRPLHYVAVGRLIVRINFFGCLGSRWSDYVITDLSFTPFMFANYQTRTYRVLPCILGKTYSEYRWLRLHCRISGFKASVSKLQLQLFHFGRSWITWIGSRTVKATHTSGNHYLAILFQ